LERERLVGRGLDVDVDTCAFGGELVAAAQVFELRRERHVDRPVVDLDLPSA
jgi:hypothetical protein